MKNVDSSRMRRVFTVAAALVLMVQSAVVARAAVAQQAQRGATISGTAMNANRQIMANTAVQLRNLATGQVVATTRSDVQGRFTFANLAAGTYSVEIVSNGQIVGSS